MNHALVLALLAPCVGGSLMSVWLTFTSRKGSERRVTAYAFGFLASVAGAVASALLHYWFWAALNAFFALLDAWNWWRNRRRRDPAPRAFGAKSQARITALVDRMAEEGV